MKNTVAQSYENYCSSQWDSIVDAEDYGHYIDDLVREAIDTKGEDDNHLIYQEYCELVYAFLEDDFSKEIISELLSSDFEKVMSFLKQNVKYNIENYILIQLSEYTEKSIKELMRD